MSWGGTRGAITAAVEASRAAGHAVSHVHLRHLNPFPRDLGDVLARFERVLVPELNEGQLALLLRGRYLVPAESVIKQQGQPFKVRELEEAIQRALDGGN